MTTTAPDFRRVCQHTGDIADPPETSDAVLLADDAASEWPATAPVFRAAAGHLTSPSPLDAGTLAGDRPGSERVPGPGHTTTK